MGELKELTWIIDSFIHFKVEGIKKWIVPFGTHSLLTDN